MPRTRSAAAAAAAAAARARPKLARRLLVTLRIARTRRAARQVKPVLLDLFERYYVPLGARTIPCLPGLVQALLAAMEDAGSEFYHRAFGLLDKVCRPSPSTHRSSPRLHRSACIRTSARSPLRPGSARLSALLLTRLHASDPARPPPTPPASDPSPARPAGRAP